MYVYVQYVTYRRTGASAANFSLAVCGEESSLVMDVKRMRLGPFFILYVSVYIYTYTRMYI